MAVAPQRAFWGSKEKLFYLPTGNILFKGLNARQIDLLCNLFPAFVASPNNKSKKKITECYVHQLKTVPSLPIRDMTWKNQYAPKTKLLPDGLALQGINFTARISYPLSSQIPSLLGFIHETDICDINIIENFLRIMVAYVALQQKGIVLHSAGIVFDDQAFLFAGKSNSGKTTLSRKAHQHKAKILSDDLNILLPEKNGYESHAVPFTGEFGRTLQYQEQYSSYPVRALLFLQKDTKLSAKTISRGLGIANLIANSPFVNTEQKITKQLFNNACQFSHKLPMICLSYRKDDSFSEIMCTVQQHLKQIRNNQSYE